MVNNFYEKLNTDPEAIGTVDRRLPYSKLGSHESLNLLPFRLPLQKSHISVLKRYMGHKVPKASRCILNQLYVKTLSRNRHGKFLIYVRKKFTRK